MTNLNDKINQFFEKSEKEILDYLFQWWEMDNTTENDSIRLIGTHEKSEKPDRNGKEFGFFLNVRGVF
jgi:hypothetical protein